MKLWMKQTLPTLLVVLLLIGTSMTVFVLIATETMLQSALNKCQYNLNAISGHMEAVGSINSNQINKDDVTKRAIIAFFFHNSARLLQNDQAKFALVVNDAYAFQTTTIPFTELLPHQDGVQAEYRLFSLEGVYTYLGYQNMTIRGSPSPSTMLLTLRKPSAALKPSPLLRKLLWESAFCSSRLSFL